MLEITSGLLALIVIAGLVIAAGFFAIMLLLGIIAFSIELTELIKMLRTHVKRWNKWRKRNTNSKFHKFMVLIGLHNSPTMAYILTDEEAQAVSERLDETRDEFVDDFSEELKELHPEWFEEVE